MIYILNLGIIPRSTDFKKFFQERVKDMKEYYKIGEISSLYNIGTDSLRYYEELGILKPQRDSNGYRMYSINDIRTLNILRELRSIGFSMKDIKEHLTDFDLAKTTELFRDAIKTIDKKQAQLSALKAQLSERIDEIEKHTSILSQCGKINLIDLPERRILRLSENVIRDDDLDFVIKKLQAEYEDQLYIIGNGDIGATIPIHWLREGAYGHFDSAFYIVSDDEEYDALLPAGQYMTMTVRGSYRQMADRWKELLDYADAHFMTVKSDGIEIYIIDNHDTSNEEEYITQLQICAESACKKTAP